MCDMCSVSKALLSHIHSPFPLLLIAAHMPRDDKAEESDQIGQGEANGNANVLTDAHINKSINKYS